MRGRTCVLALVCLIFLVTCAQGQQNGSALPKRPREANRSFGFVPKHERILQNRHAAQTRSSAIRPASYEDAGNPKLLSLSARGEGTGASGSSSAARLSYEEPLITETVVHDTIADPAHPCVVPCESAMWNRPLFWGSAEYLYWTTKGTDAPALATTSPAGTGQQAAGVLGRVGTTTLFGGELNDNERSGGRYSLSMWLNPQRTVALQASFLSLEDDTESFTASNANFPILARPFFNVQLNEEDARLIALDGLVEGDLAITATTEFEGFELILRRSAARVVGSRTDFLFGYRVADLEDLVRIDETTVSLSGPTLDSTFDLFDQFVTQNEFHGGQIGFQYTGPVVDCWSFDVLAKVAFGNTGSRLAIAGQTTTTTASGDVSTADGGLLTQASNIGTFKDDDFSTVSEFGATLRRQLRCGLLLTIGYSFLHWSDVARAGQQIDRNVNPTQIPPGALTGDARPSVLLERSDFWAQGLSIGLEYSF